MRTFDEEIAQHLKEAAESGELAAAKGYGKPLAPDAGWDATPEARRSADGALQPRRDGAPGDGRYWIYGHHAVLAALRNPRRRRARLLLTREAEAQFSPEIERAQERLGERLELVRADREQLEARLGPNAVHQGIAAEVLPLPSPALDEVLAAAGRRAILLVLDQVTDPQNVGAILRSAAHFGVSAILQSRESTLAVSGAAARVAEGGAEQVPLVRMEERNAAIAQLRNTGFQLAATVVRGGIDLFAIELPQRLVDVMGAEGEGMDEALAKACDLQLSIPGTGAVESLNVAAATAVFLAQWQH